MTLAYLSWEAFLLAYVAVGLLSELLYMRRLYRMYRGTVRVPQILVVTGPSGEPVIVSRLFVVRPAIRMISFQGHLVNLRDPWHAVGFGVGVLLMCAWSAISWPLRAYRQVRAAIRRARRCQRCGRADTDHPIFCASCETQLMPCDAVHDDEEKLPHPLCCCHEEGYELRCQDGTSAFVPPADYPTENGAHRYSELVQPGLHRLEPTAPFWIEARYDGGARGIDRELDERIRGIVGGDEVAGSLDMVGRERDLAFAFESRDAAMEAASRLADIPLSRCYLLDWTADDAPVVTRIR